MDEELRTARPAERRDVAPYYLAQAVCGADPTRRPAATSGNQKCPVPSARCLCPGPGPRPVTGP
jgi:hypothetical protein